MITDSAADTGQRVFLQYEGESLIELTRGGKVDGACNVVPCGAGLAAGRELVTIERLSFYPLTSLEGLAALPGQGDDKVCVYRTDKRGPPLH
jgi:hypothetical protein